VSSDRILRAREEAERTYELVRRSNEQIRASVELLEHDAPGRVRHRAPTCQSCHVGMTWSRSVLDETKRAVVHMFVCPRCGEQAKTETRPKLLLEPVASEPDRNGRDLIP
jgi:predicted RNA-binding Zn-ribbon protein involved in translation (DUF1610 family)